MRKPPHITFLSACTEKRLAQSRTGVWEGLTPAVAFRPREPRQTEQAPPAKKGIFRKDTTQGMPRVSSCGNLSDGQDGRGLCPSQESTEKDGSFAGDTILHIPYLWGLTRLGYSFLQMLNILQLP